MIFNLFKSKNNWQHKDSNVRIAAINEELNSDNNEDKIILLSLLNEDKSELVRRAVLLKLNSFDEYFNAITNNNNEPVQAFALAQVQDVLADNHLIKLNTEQKHTFLNLNLENGSTNNQTLNISLLNFWLEQEADPTIIVNLFEALLPKKNAPQFLLQVFAKKQSVEVQKQLLSLKLDELSQAPLLAKLCKKAVNDDVLLLINQRLAKQIEQQEKPKKLLKQCQLLLSKLLALKEQADYRQYLTKKTTLSHEWQDSLSEISCLNEEEQQELLDKHSKISAQLVQLFAPKEEAFQQAMIAEKLLSDKEAAKTDFSNAIAGFNQAIITAVFESKSIESTSSENESIDQQNFTEQLNLLSEKLTDSVLNKTEQAEFSRQIFQLEKRLTQLPEIAQSVSEATYLISKISQLALPQTLAELNERQKVYYDWISEWKKVDQKACGILPQSIKDAHKEITQLWRKGLQPLQHEQKQLFSQTKKKLIDLKRLLANGKYKVCFGLFKGVNQAMILLAVSQQHQLQRDFDNVSEKIAEISDWEHYIATPRKQELLTEITGLVNSPMDNPNEQADKVKQYRKTWNSLGHADEELDKDLNDQFNLACEQAFAPCRLFYGEQEKLREQHLVTRNKILEQAATLAKTIELTDTDSSVIDFKALDGKLNKLQQRWQQAGEVDREQYQKLFKQYKNIIQPIKKSVNDFYDANGVIKQALIVKAEQQLMLEDIVQAIEIIKKLQQQWRDIGFAGSHQESKLWQKFRAVNDQVFAKRDQVKLDQRAELDELATSFNQTLAGIQESLADVDKANVDKNALINAKDQAAELLGQVVQNKPVLKTIVNAIESFMKLISIQIEQINLAAEKQNWQSLFNLLEKMAQNKTDLCADTLASETEYLQLTSFWQKRLVELSALTTQASTDVRANKTLELEILAKIDTPTELSAQRMVVQVSLIQEQMKSGASIDLSQRFVDWLRLGQLTAEDSALLERIKKVFI